MFRRVVVTGIGAIAPNGNSAPQMWDAMKNGVNGIAPLTTIEIADNPVSVAAEVKNFDPTNYMDKKDARRMDRYCQYAMVAGSEARASMASRSAR